MVRNTAAMALILSLAGGILLTNSQSISSKMLEQNINVYNRGELLVQEAINIQKEREISFLREEYELALAETRARKKYVEEENIRKDNVHFNSYDVRSKSGISPEELYDLLIAAGGDNIADYAWDFIGAEDTYGVNAFLLVAIVAQESGWGKSARAVGQNNLTGYAVYDSSAEGATFSSAGESIYRTARLLAEEYLDASVSTFTGYSTEEINQRYCFLEDRVTVDTNWAVHINTIANNLVHKYHFETKVLEEF